MGRKLEYVHPSQLNKEDYLEADTEKLFLAATHFTFLQGEDGWDEVKYFIKRSEAYPELKGGQGYVYILENRNQPGICKIGSTTRTPQDRIKEINGGTGVIIPWTLSAAYRCNAPEVVEKLVHAELGKYRINPKKEGFSVTLDFAKSTVEQILESVEKNESSI